MNSPTIGIMEDVAGSTQLILPALSVKQPWASLLVQPVTVPTARAWAICAKDIETRIWATQYRGPFVVCSSKEPRDQGPAGQALGVRMLKTCAPMTLADEEAARCKVYDRAIGWRCGRHWPLTPFDVRGQRGLFPLLVPESAFTNEQDLAEVQQALAWAKDHDLLKYVHGF